MKLNLNDYVLVSLTSYGWKVFVENLSNKLPEPPLGYSRGIPQRHHPITINDGRHGFRLWQFIEFLGPNTVLDGFHKLFENGEMEFVKDSDDIWYTK